MAIWSVEQTVAMSVAEGVCDGIPFYWLLNDVREIDWPPGMDEKVDQVLHLAGAMLDVGFIMTDGPWTAPMDVPWPEATHGTVLERIEREYLALPAEAGLLDIGWFELPRGEANVRDELAKLRIASLFGDVSCVPVFVAAARMTPWGQTVDAARRRLIGAMIEAGFVAVEGPGAANPGRPWRQKTSRAVVARLERDFDRSVEGCTLLEHCWFRHPDGQRGHPLESYLAIIQAFLDGHIPCEKISRVYQRFFLNDPTSVGSDTPAFHAINEFFCDCEDYVENPVLREAGDFDETELRRRAEEAAGRLRPLIGQRE